MKYWYLFLMQRACSNQPIRITVVLHPENGEHVAKYQNNQCQANNGDDWQRRGQDEDVYTHTHTMSYDTAKL